MINFECPKCHASLEVDDSQSGFSAQCPQCNNVNTVPGKAQCDLKSRCSGDVLPAPDEKSRMWCAFCHIGGLIPSAPLNIIVALVFWLIKKDELPAVDVHGKTAVNFQLTCTIAYVISLLLCVIVVGYFLLAAVVIVNFIVCLIAVIKTASGEEAKYPFLIRFIS